MHSSTPDFETVKAMVNAHEDKFIDLRPFMQSRPYSCTERDKIQKVLDLFRLMNLRQLPVLDESTGLLKGVITRQDLFKYMEV
jgi:predicted transcriptional regulator